MCNAHIMRCEGVGGKAEVRFFYSLNDAVQGAPTTEGRREPNSVAKRAVRRSPATACWATLLTTLLFA
jgi:hypothetical protein